MHDGSLNKVEQIACHIAQHYLNPLTAESIGEAVDLHPNYAMSLFKKTFGTTLIDTWCRTLGGTWTRRPRPEGGTVVTLRIPQRRSTDTLGISREP